MSGISPTPRTISLALAGSAPFAAAFLWPQLAWVGWSVLGLLALAFLWDAVQGRRTPLTASRSLPDPLYQAEPAFYPLTVTNPSGRPVSLTVREVLGRELTDAPLDRELVVPAGAQATVKLRALPTVRGDITVQAPVVRLTGPLGLAFHTRTLGEVGSARVFPRMRQPEDAELLLQQLITRPVGTIRERFKGVSQEIHGLRNYLPGDPMRHLDWKATARLQRPVTREYTLAQNQQVVILLDAGRSMAAHTDGASQFDHALSSALALLRVAVTQGDEVTLLIYDQDIRSVVKIDRRSRGFQALFARLYDIQPSDTEAHHALAAQWVLRHCKRRSLVVCLSAAADMGSADRLSLALKTLAGRHVPLWVNLTDPDLSEVAGSMATSTVQAYAKLAAMEITDANQAAWTRLRGSGVHIHSTDARQLTLGLLRHYVQLKGSRL